MQKRRWRDGAPVSAAVTLKEVREATGAKKSPSDPEKAKQDEEQRKLAKKEARRARLDAPRLAEEEAERRVAVELLSKPQTGAAAVLP